MSGRDGAYHRNAHFKPRKDSATAAEHVIVIVAGADHRLAVAAPTAAAIRPAMPEHQRGALGINQQG
ncbi:hypothetical protein [Rhodopila globiformis]|nr:hypothetical protein [Rhodopila globiformis]